MEKASSEQAPSSGDTADGEKLSTEALWEAIGFHKPLAGFWYNLTFSLIGLVLTIFITGALVNIFYPYPESNGYRSVTSGIFALFYTIMDLGTNMTMDRFIADARIRNPTKMMQYIQYFIWYQAITGLFQTTIVSYYALFIVPYGNLAYGMWLMLIVASYQYPGYLGVFSGVLGSLQHYHRTMLLGFISGQIFNRVTELSFVFLGRLWGQSDPRIGEILGIAIGANIGTYICNFFSMWLSAYYFTKAMKGEGLRARDCFRHDFDFKLVKECAVFGIKTGMPNIIGVATSLIILWESILFIPQYTTYATLAGLASGISGFVNWGNISAPTPALAESYLNGKKILTQYYITATVRYITLFQMLFLPMILSILFILNRFLVELNMLNYLLAVPFFIPTLIFQSYTSFADSIQLGCNRPTFLMIIRFAEECLKVFFTTLWLVILHLVTTYGFPALIWVMPLGIFPAVIFKTVAAYIRIHKTIVKVSINKYQTLVVPLTSGAIMFGGLFSLLFFVITPLENIIGFFPAIIIALVLLLLIVLFVYLPLTALLGGWDTMSLREFKQAAQMSGPSKLFVWPMYKMTELACKKSKLFNKHPIDSTEAMIEARELWEMKKSHMIKTLLK